MNKIFLYLSSTVCGLVTFTTHASCSSLTPGSGDNVTCTGADAPSIIAMPGSTNVTINLDSTTTGSYSLPAQATPFSVDSSSRINNSGMLSVSGNGTGVTNRGALLLGVNNDNVLTNTTSGTLITTGAYNDGMAANGNNNILVNNGTIITSSNNSYGMTVAWGQSNPGTSGNTIINTGTVSTTGNNARAVSLLGGNGIVNNSGILSTAGKDAPTVYMQGNNATLNNSGIIKSMGTATSGGSVDGVVSNTLASSFTATINNLPGGQIISYNGTGIRSTNGKTSITNAGLIQGGGGKAIQGGSGNISLTLQTGSKLIGTADGGGGSNTVMLEGSGLADNAFTNFQTLNMMGNEWTWSGKGTFSTAQIQSGVLNLTGTLGVSTASVTAQVSNGATLQANSSNLPLEVSNDGLVNFLQISDGSYSGAITGIGGVEKSGVGLLYMENASTYTGGTTLTGGTLLATADNMLGADTGALILNGGALRLGSAFNLSPSRAVSVTANNGTIDTQDFTSVVEQAISGDGTLTKTGRGTLVLNGANSYAGGTLVDAGTFIVGDSDHSLATINGGATIATGATLGGFGSVSGNVSNSGTLAAASALPYLSAGPVGNFSINGNLTNSGLIQLGGNDVGNTLTIRGDYSGQNATIAMNSMLAGDGAASDRLILSGGSASGMSTLNVTNKSGAGAQTTLDGIQVVQALNGATTSPTAFTLSGGTVSAGAYSYYLAKGGVSGNSNNNWYLRNTVVKSSPVGGESALLITPAPGTPEAISNASAGGRGTDGEIINVYRPEAALYAGAPLVARQLNLQQIDTFHDRQGEQSLLNGDNKVTAFWGRYWGSHTDIQQSGDVNPSFSGTLWGLQMGQDLYTATPDDASTHHFGVLFGYSRATGNVDGFALAQQGITVGKLQFNNYNFGGYWTRVASSGWYTDAVIMGSSLKFNTNSINSVGASSSGNAITSSVESGIPIELQEDFIFEPQAQLVWQHIILDALNDGVSEVHWNNSNTWQGRLGTRFQWTFDRNGIIWKPYLRASVLRSFGQDDETTFEGNTKIFNGIYQTYGQVSGGVVVHTSKKSVLYATTSYKNNIGSEHANIITGNIGVRWYW